MRHRRTARLGRWRRRISEACKLNIELARLVETVTVIVKKLTGLAFALAGLCIALRFLITALH